MRKISKIEPCVPVMKKRKRVAAYARVSMETERMMHSLSAQVSYYSGLIQSNPEWEYAGVYTDDFISGTSAEKRDGFKRMVDDCMNGKIDIVLTKSVSRFARNTVDLLETVRKLKDKGVEVRFEKENISSMSGDGELMLTILASFAQEESRSISENVKWGVRKRKEQGIPNGRFRVYGYRWEDDELVIVPEEAEVVRRIFQNFLDGKSRLETEREFAAEGITTRDGCRWVDSNIRGVLTNITYTGNMLLQKEYISDPISKHRKKNHGELPQYYVEDTHPAIIDKATFDYVQSEIIRRRELGPLANKSLNTSCFTGKIKCGVCGKSFMRNTRNNRARQSELGDKLISWTCGTRKHKGGRCTSKEIPDRILKQKCCEVLGIEEFDPDIFTSRIDHIFIPENGVMVFFFRDGTQKDTEWENTAHKDCWTAEYRAWVSKQRRETPHCKGVSVFTGKIKCSVCGCNFRRWTQKSSKYGKVNYWRCVEHGSDCKAGGLREDMLKNIISQILGTEDFEDDVFRERVAYIMVREAYTLDVYLTNGGQKTAVYIPQKIKGGKV